MENITRKYIMEEQREKRKKIKLFLESAWRKCGKYGDGGEGVCMADVYGEGMVKPSVESSN